MPLLRNYSCTVCGNKVDRKDLLVKKVLFVGMGAGGKTVRSRVKGHLCPTCTVKDLDWNLPDSQGSGYAAGRLSG